MELVYHGLNILHMHSVFLSLCPFHLACGFFQRIPLPLLSASLCFFFHFRGVFMLLLLFLAPPSHTHIKPCHSILVSLPCQISVTLLRAKIQPRNFQVTSLPHTSDHYITVLLTTLPNYAYTYYIVLFPFMHFRVTLHVLYGKSFSHISTCTDCTRTRITFRLMYNSSLFPSCSPHSTLSLPSHDLSPLCPAIAPTYL